MHDAVAELGLLPLGPEVQLVEIEITLGGDLSPGLAYALNDRIILRHGASSENNMSGVTMIGTGSPRSAFTVRT
jgi:hypothetical protein